MTGILVVCIGNLQTSDCQKKRIRLHSLLKPSHPLLHNAGHRTGGNMMKTTKHGLDTASNPAKDYTSRVMRGERVLVEIQIA